MANEIEAQSRQDMNLLIKHVRIPNPDWHLEQHLVNVACNGSGRVWKITEVTDTAVLQDLRPATSWREIDGKGGLLIPS